MPLYSVPEMTLMRKLPYKRDNEKILSRINEADLNAIHEELNKRIDEVANSDEKLITSGWIPGSDWENTVFQPIWIASGKNYERAAMVFGAIVFQVMMEREEDWAFGKYHVNGRSIGSTTYFRIYPDKSD